MVEILLVLMEALVHQKTSSINSNKEKKNVCLILNCNANNSFLFVNEKEILKLKADNGTVNFPTQYPHCFISNYTFLVITSCHFCCLLLLFFE